MIEFLKEMTVRNRWLWFHILAGGTLAKFFIIFDTSFNAILGVAVIAIMWEAFEALILKDINNYSGGTMGWFADSLGDVLGAVLMALVVVL